MYQNRKNPLQTHFSIFGVKKFHEAAIVKITSAIVISILREVPEQQMPLSGEQLPSGLSSTGATAMVKQEG